MATESVDRDAVGWICHTASDEARYHVKKANYATCLDALAELNQVAAAEVKKGRKEPAFKTIRHMLAVRLRKLAKEQKGGN